MGVVSYRNDLVSLGFQYRKPEGLQLASGLEAMAAVCGQAC
jgi:hypothetical protein